MGQINLLKTDTPQTPASGRTGIFIDSTNAPILILSDGTEIPLGGTTLEQIYIDAITGGLSPSSENPFVTISQLQTLTGGTNNVLFGGVVQWSGTGLGFYGSASGYIIENQYYEIVQDNTLTLATADPTNDRRDTFKLTTTGWGINTGTPAPIPVAPAVDPITEINRGDVLVEASATTPTVSNENVYLENTEWVTTSSGTGTFDPDDTSDPFAGTKDFSATSIQSGATMIFTRASDIDLTNYSSIGLQLKLLANMNNGRNVFVQFFDNSDNALSSGVTLPIVKTNSSTYQFVAIPLDQFGFSDFTIVRKLHIRYGGTGGAATYSGYLVDNVILQSGFTQAPSNVFTQDEIDAIKSANLPTAANPFATIADTGASYPEMLALESNTVLFDNDYSIGIESTARSGNVLFNFTGALRGASSVMRHNDGAAFTFPTENLIISGSYVASVDNYICFILVNKTISTEVVLCTITQAV